MSRPFGAFERHRGARKLPRSQVLLWERPCPGNFVALVRLLYVRTNDPTWNDFGGAIFEKGVQVVAAKKDVSQVQDEVATGGYSLFNLQTSYQWSRLRIDFGLDNLFNRAYSMPLGGAYVGQGMTMSEHGVPWGVPVPGMGRSIYTALAYKF